MKDFLFSIYKKKRKIEYLFIERPLKYLHGTRFFEFLKQIPGLRTLYKLECNFSNLIYYELRPKGIIVAEVEGSKMYVNTEDKTMVPCLLSEGVWEKDKTELFKKNMKPGMTVVDVGAGIGYYTLIAAKLVGNNGIVYAFEPEPCNYELLCRNIKLNGLTNVVTIKKAVSDRKGKACLYFEKDRIVNPSLSRENVLTASNREVLDGGDIEVETINLDEFFNKTVGTNKIDVIKVDSEGAEGLIIDGASEILKNNSLKIFIEFWPAGLERLGTNPLKMLKKLEDYGFKVKIIDGTHQFLTPIEMVNFYKKMEPNYGCDLLLEN